MKKEKLLHITKYGVLLIIVAIGAFCTAYMAAIWATQPAELSGARVEIFTTEASAKSSLEIDCNSGHISQSGTVLATRLIKQLQIGHSFQIVFIAHKHTRIKRRKNE